MSNGGDQALPEPEEALGQVEPVAGYGLSSARWARFFATTRVRGLRALSHHSYAVLWAAFLATQVGFWVCNLSFQWVVAEETGADSLMLGLLFFFNFLPLFLFSPVGGTLADRYERRLVVVGSQIAVACVALTLAAVTLVGATEPAVLFVLAFVLGSALSVNVPAYQAIVANSVPRDDVASAVSLQAMSGNLSRIAGPALAVPILVVWGAGPAFAVYAVAATYTAVAISRLRLPPVPLATDEDGGTIERIRAGLRHARERRPALAVLSMVAVTSVFGSSYIVLFPVFATEVLGQNESAFTVIVALTGVGAVLGALATGSREEPVTVAAAGLLMLGLAAALVAFALSPSYAVTLVLAVVAGAFNFAVLTVLNSKLQHIVDEDKRGRVMSLYAVCWGGLIPIGGLLIGSVSAAAGPRTAVVVVASVCACYAAAMVVTGRREREAQAAT